MWIEPTPVDQSAASDAVTDSLQVGPAAVPLDWGLVLVKAAEVAGVVLLTWLVYRAIVLVTRRIEKKVEEEEDPDFLTLRKQRTQTVAQLSRNVALVSLVVVGALTVLNLFIPIGPLLAGVGVFGLAISFGAQTLVRDVISGFFILAEGQYAVGDVIRINNETAGQVQRMTLRVVVLRDIEGVVHTIPNGEVKQVANLTKEWSRALLHVGVAYGEDVDHVIETLEDVGRELHEDPEWGELLLEEPVVPGVERFEDSAVVVRIMAKTLPLKQWDVMRQMRRRIKKRFDAEGIEIPFPHRTVYWGTRQGRPAWMAAAPEEPAVEGPAAGGDGGSVPERDDWE